MSAVAAGAAALAGPLAALSAAPVRGLATNQRRKGEGNSLPGFTGSTQSLDQLGHKIFCGYAFRPGSKGKRHAVGQYWAGQSRDIFQTGG